MSSAARAPQARRTSVSGRIRGLAARFGSSKDEELRPARDSEPRSPYDDPNVSAYAIRNALTFAAWVHRRSESISFPDPETTRRQQSIDFTIPVGDGLEKDQIVFLPLHLLRKVNLRNFDLRDETGAALQTLTSLQNGRVASLGLETILASDWPRETRELREILEKIVFDQRSDASLDPIEFASTQTTDGALAAALRSPLGPSWDFLAGLIRELSRSFMLLVPVRYEPGRRRLIKVSFDAAKGVQEAEAAALARAYRRTNRLLSSLGFTARQEEVSDLQVGWAYSYHVEVDPPTEMWVAEASLEVDEGPAELSSSHYRPHFRVSNRERFEVGTLTLLLNPRRESLVFPLFGSALAIAAMLAFVPEHLKTLDAQVLGALLLLPFALIAYYVRGAEHRYVSTAMRGVRILAGIPVLAAVAVLGMLGLGVLGSDTRSGEVAYEIAVWSSRIAGLATAFLVPSLFFPELAKLFRPIVRGSQDRMRAWPALLSRVVSGTVIGLIGGGGIVAVIVLCEFAVQRLPVH